jgi:Ca2+-binding RTX toxin-like protein
VATVSLKNVTSDFGFEHMLRDILPDGVFQQTTPTTYRYVANGPGAIGVNITGSNLDYDPGAYPIAGTVKEVRLDFGNNNASKAEVVVTGLSAAFSRLDWRYIPDEHEVDFMWALMLDGNDKVDLGSRATADGFSIAFAADGIYAATFCGNDTISGDAGELGFICGDLQKLPENYVRYGGDDEIRLSNGNAVGDALNVDVGATMVSGDDYLSLKANGSLAGDVFYLYGNTSGGNDTILGSSGADALSGDVGVAFENTTMRGGHDSIKGGGGNDSIWGDEQAFSGGGQVYRGGNDRLYGEAGKDTIVGGGGNDVIVGGTAVDRLTGGDGKDQFRFAEKGTTHADVITDFKHGTDKIALENTVFAALGSSVTSSEFLSRSSGHAATNDKHIIYDRSNGQVWYDPDDNGSAVAVLVATLTTKPSTLSYSDFIIV